MQTCKKTHRKCTVAELIWKVGRKLEGKGIQATGEDHHFCEGKYSAGFQGIRMGKNYEAGITDMEKLPRILLIERQ